MLFSLKQIPIPEIVRYALGTALPSPIPQEFLSLAQNAAQEVLSCCQPKYHLVRYPVQPLLDLFNWRGHPSPPFRMQRLRSFVRNPWQ